MEIKNLIGNTPLIKIKLKYNNKVINVYAKLEYYNLTGSIKDRLAYYIIDKSYKDGTLQKGMPIVEATSGNTGISFAALGAYFKHKVHIFMPDWVSEERIKLMKMYGAEVYLVSKEEGGFKEAIKRANKLAKEINGFRPNQFNNYKNIETHYYETGLEIVNSIPKIDGFVSGIGTGGTIIGIAKRLKEVNKKIVITAIEPEELPIMTKGIKKGSHKIEGIGDDFIPEIVDKSLIDKIILINSEDAINMARIMSKKYGIGIGISSGANLLGAALTGNDLDNIVTIFVDDSKKYITTDLSKDINNDKRLVSNQIEIISIDSV